MMLSMIIRHSEAARIWNSLHARNNFRLSRRWVCVGKMLQSSIRSTRPHNLWPLTHSFSILIIYLLIIELIHWFSTYSLLSTSLSHILISNFFSNTFCFFIFYFLNFSTFPSFITSFSICWIFIKLLTLFHFYFITFF